MKDRETKDREVKDRKTKNGLNGEEFIGLGDELRDPDRTLRSTETQSRGHLNRGNTLLTRVHRGETEASCCSEPQNSYLMKGPKQMRKEEKNRGLTPLRSSFSSETLRRRNGPLDPEPDLPFHSKELGRPNYPPLTCDREDHGRSFQRFSVRDPRDLSRSRLSPNPVSRIFLYFTCY